MADPIAVKEVIETLSSNPKYDYSYFLSQSSPNLANLLISRMLTGKGRPIVIKLIKWPIERTLIKSVRLFIRVFGRVTKETTAKHNTHVILDLRQEFFQHYINPGKMELMESAWELLAFEIEHDNAHYGWLFDWLVTRIAEEKAKGNWVEMEKTFPQENCWKE